MRMKQTGFNEAKEFIKNMVDDYKISEPGTHVGIVEYSDEPTIRMRLRDTFNKKAIKTAVDTMTPSEGSSGNLAKALENAVEMMFSVAMGGRPSAKKILVVITASDTLDKEGLKKASKPLKEQGVRIYVVPVGEKSKPETLVVLVPDDTKVPKKVKIPKLADHSRIVSEKVKDDLVKSKWNC